jgi:hypothetical protein
MTIIFVCAVSLGLVQLCHASSDPFLDGQLKVFDSKINGWDHSANVVETLVFLAVLAGIVVAAMQAASNWWQMKVLIAVLSVAGAAFGAYSHQFFPADDRAYRKAARQARGLVTNFRLQLERLHTIDERTQDSLDKAFKELYAAIEQIEDSLNGSSPGTSSSQTGMSLVSSAYAQDDAAKGAPEWVGNPPYDDKNFYFVGTATAKSFDQAKQDAIANAQTMARTSFQKQAGESTTLKNKPELLEQLVHAIVDGGEIVRSVVLPTASGDFTGYVLLRISKAPARFAAESVFVRKSEPYDKAFLQRVQPKDEK